MGYNGDSLEQLLESLIKMVGKTNEHMDSLNKRVKQLEWVLQEFQVNEQDGRKKYFVTAKAVRPEIVFNKSN